MLFQLVSCEIGLVLVLVLLTHHVAEMLVSYSKTSQVTFEIFKKQANSGKDLTFWCVFFIRYFLQWVRIQCMSKYNQRDLEIYAQRFP